MVLVTCNELLLSPPDIAVPGRVYYTIGTTLVPLQEVRDTSHVLLVEQARG